MRKNTEPLTVFTREQLDSYFASYVGMEGGNPGAAVWFCDSSPHPGVAPLSGPLIPHARPTAWDAAYRSQYRHHMERWQSHQKIARIMAAARARVFKTTMGEQDWRHYFDHHLYGPQGAEFKLSLFPLPARLTDEIPWSKAFRGQPQLFPRRRYLDLCREGRRFAFIDGIRRLWKPTVVVCLGERHADDFAQAFGLAQAHATDHVLQPADQPKTLRVLERDGTTWLICPPLAGAGGMMSDVLLDAMGQYLSRWLRPDDFPVHVMGEAQESVSLP
ncbi:transcriptional regulator [Cupriavidus alkaliphilus]|uniref:Transcriptional activator of eps genes n=1 Tax=Cupriavidus alkaliphilus TaxID=942866 RepID=A0A7W4YQ60_9BURK|nr:transcriptional regulator [Cupriavidus alkaliphilus]MBB3006584.1 transcriptional activator of eps genes [Cupriavidus alkaliphilus]